MENTNDSRANENDLPEPDPVEPGDPDREDYWLKGGFRVIKKDSQCHSCAHYDEVRGTEHRCTAFPEGIPIQIYLHQHDHRFAWPGDDGVRFAQDPTKPAFDHDAATFEDPNEYEEDDGA